MTQAGPRYCLPVFTARTRSVHLPQNCLNPQSRTDILPWGPVALPRGCQPLCVQATAQAARRALRECHTDFQGHCGPFVLLAQMPSPGRWARSSFLPGFYMPSPLYIKMQTGTSLAGARWLRLHALSAGGPGLIPSQGTEISNASLWGLKNRIPQTDHVTLFAFEDLQ